jgi:arginyl-tRNA synthetase
VAKEDDRMKPVVDILEQRISAAMAEASARTGCRAIVGPATDPKFGDYQVNGVMSLAKQVKANPRKLAEEVVKKLDLSDICESPEVAGPGFINLRLKPAFVAARLLEISKDAEQFGIDKAAQPKTIVVDFSSPNIAKEMHVGHLRSTIIGDCICRLLEFQGHTVIRQNHLGDWGTHFGMLIHHLISGYVAATLEGTTGRRIEGAPLSVGDMEQFYRDAKKAFDSDPDFARESRDWVVRLQNGDTLAHSYWNNIVNMSLFECQSIYEKLGVTLNEKDVRGESFYKDMLKDVVQELQNRGIAVKSEGAVCVFPPGFKNKDGEPLPMIIQKSDGAYLYATTDLAAIRYRVNVLKADRIIYVTDARQSQHFAMLFKVAEMAGWNERDGKQVELVHVTFGSVLGENGKPLKTREGENIKLRELLEEAVAQARKIVEEKNPELPADHKDKIATAVGIGAVKYADFSNNRTSDYVFSFDKMLAMDGNTAPYMQYAYARIRSIERKAQSKGVNVEAELSGVKSLSLTEPDELALAKHLIRYGESVQSASADYRPNYLTSYLYDLAQKFSAFYTTCPVLDAPTNKKPTRLLLCRLTALIIKHGLTDLLGIQVVDQM